MGQRGRRPSARPRVRPSVPGAGAARSSSPTCAAASSRRGRGTVPRGHPPVPPPPRPSRRPRPRRAPPPPRAAGPRAGRAPPRTSRALSQVNTAGSTRGKFYGDGGNVAEPGAPRRPRVPGMGISASLPSPGPADTGKCFTPGLDSPLPRGSGSPCGVFGPTEGGRVETKPKGVCAHRVRTPVVPTGWAVLGHC